MKIKYYLAVAVLALLGWWLRPREQSVDPVVAWDALVRQPLFRPIVASGRWYEGTISGYWGSGASSYAIQGSLGFGSNNQQSYWYYKGDLGPYFLAGDVLHESRQSFVRMHQVSSTGVVQIPFRYQLLTLLTQTNGAFVSLRGLDSYTRIQYVLNPKDALVSFSGAVSIDTTQCVSRTMCRVFLDTDLIAGLLYPQKADLLMAFLQAVEQQTIRYNPLEQIITIDVLGSRTVSVSGKIGPRGFRIMRDRRGPVRDVVTVDHQVNNNRHMVMITVEQDGEVVRDWSLAYDVYPDGWDMNIRSFMTGMFLDIKGNWYDAGVFAPVKKERVVDIYGLLDTKKY